MEKTIQAIALASLCCPSHVVPSDPNSSSCLNIVSRIQTGTNLFRQGVLPGPDLLMKVLQGSLPPDEAKREWKAVEKELRAYSRLCVPARSMHCGV